MNSYQWFGFCLILLSGAPMRADAVVGTYPIDDNNPTGSGLTISARPPADFRQATADLHAFADTVAVPFGTSNADTADEFQPVLTGLDTLRNDVTVFRTRLQNFAAAVRNATSVVGPLLGNLNPISYTWRDSRGDHTMTIEVGPFKMPTAKTEKRGNILKGKICLVLKEYKDNGSKAWVKVTRNDLDSAQQHMTWWRWNPFGGRLSKISRVSYSFDHVDLAGTR